jgi:hypothetical protein
VDQSTQDLDVSKFPDKLKKLYVERSLRDGLFYIRMQGGGPAPNALQSAFTSHKAADTYLYFYLVNKTFIPERTYGANKRVKNI